MLSVNKIKKKNHMLIWQFTQIEVKCCRVTFRISVTKLICNCHFHSASLLTHHGFSFESKQTGTLLNITYFHLFKANSYLKNIFLLFTKYQKYVEKIFKGTYCAIGISFNKFSVSVLILLFFLLIIDKTKRRWSFFFLTTKYFKKNSKIQFKFELWIITLIIVLR